MKRKVIIVLAVVIALGVLFYFFACPVVISNSQKELVNIKDTTLTHFNPLENIDFTNGNNVAYLHIAKSDIEELPKGIAKSKILECRSNKILQDIQRDFVFTKSNGDMATCESEILIYKEEKLVLRSSIVLTDSVIGLQNSKFGWSNAQNRESLKISFKRFKPTNKAFVKL